MQQAIGLIQSLGFSAQKATAFGELGLGVGEAQQQAAALALDAGRLETGTLEAGDDAGLDQLVDARAAGRRELHRGVVAEHVRQRVDDSDREHHRDQGVLPGGILIQHRRFSVGDSGEVVMQLGDECGEVFSPTTSPPASDGVRRTGRPSSTDLMRP